MAQGRWVGGAPVPRPRYVPVVGQGAVATSGGCHADLYDAADEGFGCAVNLDLPDGSEWGDGPFDG